MTPHVQWWPSVLNSAVTSTHSLPTLRGWDPPLALVKTAEMATELVAHGADVNAADEDMVTVLMCAVGNCNEVAVRFLLEAGADPAAVDSLAGRTAIDWAYKGLSGEDVVMLLLEAGVVPGQERVLMAARDEGHDRVVGWLEGGDGVIVSTADP